MNILSINIGKVENLFSHSADQHRVVETGIHKQPVKGLVQVYSFGLAGDEQADLVLHGGLEKAVYAYPAEHYQFWGSQLALHRKCEAKDISLPVAAFGENLTLQGILESDVWVGDLLSIGDVVFQITEPRHPCFKLNAKLGFSQASRVMIQSGFSGFYLRVLQVGAIQAGDAIVLSPGPREIALSLLNERRKKGRQEALF